MSEQNLTHQSDLTLGFYGKLPSLGDFVSRRLSQDFIVFWDAWLQSSLSASRELLGDRWLQCYLTSPIWRFALSPGLSGNDAWIGIVMPSVDRVGRYFPLTITSKVTADVSLIHLFSQAGYWFEELEAIALSALENDLTVEQFDGLLKGISLLEIKRDGHSISDSDKDKIKQSQAFYLEFESSDIDAEQVLPDLSVLLLQKYLPGHSLWCSIGSDSIKPGFLVAQGMLPCTAYAGMITGQFQQQGWALYQQQIVQSDNQAKFMTQGNNKDTSSVQSAKSDTQKVQDICCNTLSSTPEQRELVKAWKSFSRTDSGLVRPYNEDAILDRPDMGLWVVADGMGGHQAGDVASKKIIHTLSKLHLTPSLDSSIAQVKAALQLVNNELKDLSIRSFDRQIVGSTVVALIAGETQFACLWAGDSRLYRLRDDKLLQLTIDHCKENEDIMDVLKSINSTELDTDSTRLNVDPKTTLKQNNVITRAVGAYDQLELDCQLIDIQSGDLLLLSSDGLDKELSFQEIEQVLIENAYNDSVEILLEQALKWGGRDNISVIVVDIQ